MSIRRMATIILLLVGGSSPVLAQSQSGGQFCVRAFEDRNGNQQHDGGEPFLTRGVAAQLLDSTGVVIGSGLMDTSPTAAQGVICFPGLASGQYTLLVSSVDYARTTPDSMTVSIQPGELPTVFLYGAQRMAVSTTTGGASGPRELSPAEQTLLLERVAVAAGGAVIVVVIMLALGTIIYFVSFRSRFARAVPDVYMSPRVTTGSHPAVRASDSGEYPKV